MYKVDSGRIRAKMLRSRVRSSPGGSLFFRSGAAVRPLMQGRFLRLAAGSSAFTILAVRGKNRSWSWLNSRRQNLEQGAAKDAIRGIGLGSCLDPQLRTGTPNET